jgi:uncharacterized repeat protein (TIGR03803 family)
MKAFMKNQFLLPTLIASLNLILTGHATAQTFTTLHNFSALDGGDPYNDLILSGNILYGATLNGGSSGNGAIYAINTDGAGFTNLYTFNGVSDGAEPDGLIISGTTLYGTGSYSVETNGYGAGDVFKVNTDGTGFTNLHKFAAGVDTGIYTNSDGANPGAGVILSSNRLFGTTYDGAVSGWGTVFAVNTDGTAFTILHSFTRSGTDGAYPLAKLTLSGSTLYGTTGNGGSFDDGTVFRINTDGTGFTNLYSFTAVNFNLTVPTNSDGRIPRNVLILSDNTLYGATLRGGTSGSGTVFKINTDGTGFKNLHNFTAIDFNSGSPTNSGGALPIGGLVLQGKHLFGTTVDGGIFGNGTIFMVNTDGSGFSNLHNFNTDTDGAYPYAGLILSGNTLYGAAQVGGSSGNGTVFSLTLPSPPPLTITPFAANVILFWPTNATGFPFTLQATTNLVSQAVWTTVSPVSAVVSGLNTVTNPISGAQKFYRLSQ